MVLLLRDTVVTGRRIHSSSPTWPRTADSLGWLVHSYPPTCPPPPRTDPPPDDLVCRLLGSSVRVLNQSGGRRGPFFWPKWVKTVLNTQPFECGGSRSSCPR